MRIYNGKNSQVDLPVATQRISIAPHMVSGDIMPNTELLSLIATSFDDTELALIIAGPAELNMCANVPAVTPLVVQSLEEAVKRFTSTVDEKEKEPEAIPETPTIKKVEEVVIVPETPEAPEQEKKEAEITTSVPVKDLSKKRNKKR